MKGRKIPFTRSRAIAYMQFNEVFGKERKALKKQARKEDRRYQKRQEIIIKENTFDKDLEI